MFSLRTFVYEIQLKSCCCRQRAFLSIVDWYNYVMSTIYKWFVYMYIMDVCYDVFLYSYFLHIAGSVPSVHIYHVLITSTIKRCFLFKLTWTDSHASFEESRGRPTGQHLTTWYTIHIWVRATDVIIAPQFTAPIRRRLRHFKSLNWNYGIWYN